MKNNLIQEEINRAKTIWGYNTRLILNEQPNYDPTTGTGPNPTCPDSTPGSFMGGAGFTGNFIDPNDPICQGIFNQAGYNPSINQYQQCCEVSQAPDPFYCVGGVAGMSCIQASTPPGGTTAGGPFNTMADCQNSGCGGTQTGSCNKTCQEMAPGFKKKAGVRNCNWLTNKLPVLINKLATKTPGTCPHKRITCKIGVVEYLIESKGC